MEQAAPRSLVINCHHISTIAPCLLATKHLEPWGSLFRIPLDNLGSGEISAIAVSDVAAGMKLAGQLAELGDVGAVGSGGHPDPETRWSIGPCILILQLLL